MRIIGGAWRGRALMVPAGEGTRPTADRVRQALFDRLMHAPWAAGALPGAVVLDAFAGTGALGLEALSRGAARAVFIERDRAALAVLRANIAACGAAGACRVVPGDVLRPQAGERCGLVFMDPPYGFAAKAAAVGALRAAGWFAPGALLVLETGREEAVDAGEPLAVFTAGRATVRVLRL